MGSPSADTVGSYAAPVSAMAGRKRKPAEAAKAAAGAAALAVPGLGEAELALGAAQAAAASAERLLTTPIVTLGGQHFRVHEVKVGRRKECILTPIDWKLNVNLLNLGLGAIAVGVAAVGALFAWNGIATGGLTNRAAIQILPGLKDNSLGKHLVECRNAKAIFDQDMATGQVGAAQAAWDSGKYLGCTWTRYTPRPKG